MVGVAKRMARLQERLFSIRLGSGALVLPKDVKRIHLQFLPQANGHMGARKFWHNELVRLKYHNPAVPMTVDRTTAREDSASLSIHFAAPDSPQTSDSATSSPAVSRSRPPSDYGATQRVETIDMLNQHSSYILEQVVKLTNAYPIEATAGEKAQMKELEERKVMADRARVANAERRAKQKREEDLLKQARGQVQANV